MARLHALKEWSGLTYRELAQRAGAVGDVLPRSTVANMLSRSTLPREELVVAFVRACGSGPDGIDSWLRVRKELARRERQSTEVPEYGAGGALAAGGTVAVDEPAEPDNAVRGAAEGQSSDGEPAGSGPGGGAAPAAADTSDLVPDAVAERVVEGAPGDDARGADGAAGGAVDRNGPAEESPSVRTGPTRLAKPSRRTLLLVVSAVVAIGAVLATLVYVMRDSGGDAPGPPQNGAVRPSFSMGAAMLEPAPGKVFIRPAGSRWCLGERSDDSGQIFQVSCESKILPDFRIELSPSGWWRIENYHPVHGERCTGITGRRPESGSVFTNQKCNQRGDGELFRIEPVTEAGPGVYTIRPAHPGACMTLETAPDGISAHVVLRPCREGRTGQRFVLERRS
ncbi:helix-turn-helix domain-containing protein [Streptomyces sp. NPDC047315]|uniref:helix-turn-helix domain-containing protein n=1 Tax=Streptomyces sp. NPDC047315 TaxID=3155142 RepID=UPI0033CA551E